MRLPRVRFTVRRVMFVVAIVALILGGTAEGVRRRERFRRKAQEYARTSNDLYLRGFYFGKETTFGPSPAEVRISDEYERRSIQYQRLSEKYERAARSPWLPVEPDPPEPKTSGTGEL